MKMKEQIIDKNEFLQLPKLCRCAVVFACQLAIFPASFSPKAWQVTNGKNAMPAFGERLGPDDIEAP